MKIIDYVIYDRAHDVYVMCWTEGNTIFLTSNFDKIETYTTRKHALEMVERIKSSDCTFLSDDNDARIPNPELIDLVAGQLVVETKFVLFS